MPKKHIDALLCLNDEAFIDNVYKYALERESDEKGKAYFLAKLREYTLTKSDILYILQNSEEGRSIHLPSKKNIIKYKIHKIPFLGYITQSITTLFTLPKLIKKIEQTHINLAKDINQNTHQINDIFSILTSNANESDLIMLRDRLNRLILSKNKVQHNKKILICCNAYPPHFIGGAELIAHYQALELQKQGYTVKVFAGNLPLETEHYSTTQDYYEGIEVFRVKLEESDFDGNTINFRHAEVEKHFEHILNTFQPSIVHMHNIIGLSVALASITKKFAIKTVMTLHDGWGFCYKNTIMRNDGQFCHDFTECSACIPFIHKKSFGAIPIHMRQDYFTLALRDIDIFISPSQYLKDQYIQANFKADKIHVLANGIEINKFNLTHVKSDKIRFTFIGYLGEHKGVHLILQALTLLKNKNNIQLTIIGEGVLGDELKNYITEKNLSSYVTLLGKVSNHEIPAIFSQTDVYILPSQWPENQPVTITEAFASKVPVIGTDFGGIKELVTHKETGLLFPMGDTQSLATQIDYFIDNPKKIKEYGQNAFEFIKDKSFTTQVSKLITYYSAPVPFLEKEKAYVVACVGSHLSTASIEIMSFIRQNHTNIYFVLHEWLINPYAYDLLWFTDKELSISILDKYSYLQKPYLVNVKEKIIKDYALQGRHSFAYSDVAEFQIHIKNLSK